MDNTENIDFRRYLGLLSRRKHIAIAVALTVLSVFTWGSYFWPKTYEAGSTVLIEKNAIMEPLIQGVGVSNNIENRLASVRDSIMSRNILEKVTKKINTDAIAHNPAKYEGSINKIRKNLKIATKGGRDGGADIFTISYRDNDPVKVRDLVNTLVQEYIDETLGFRKTDVLGAYDFIDKQVLEYKNKLEESDRAQREFRERNPNMVPQNETVMAGRIEKFQATRTESEIKLKELIRKRENLQKQLSGEKELTVAFVTSEGSPQARLNHLTNQLMLLMGKYTDSYPEVIKIKSEIEELKKQISQPKTSTTQGVSSTETAAINPIYQQLREDLARTDAEVESLRARIAELSRQQREGERILGNMPKEQEEWTKLQRDRNVYQKIYDELLQKLEQARVSTNLEVDKKGGSFKIIEKAILPRLPIQPNRVQMILLGIVLGVVSGVAVVIGLEQFNHSFNDEASIESVMKLPVLATVPVVVTEEEELVSRRRDKYVYTAAGAYLLVICLVFVMEFLYRYMGVGIAIF